MYKYCIASGALKTEKQHFEKGPKEHQMRARDTEKLGPRRPTEGPRGQKTRRLDAFMDPVQAQAGPEFET
jgi:hypothetical protein